MTSAGRMTVLVVDDEPLARQRLERLLNAEAGVDLLASCANGREAVAAIRAHAPDLVFLDVQMPEMDGFAVVADIGARRMPAVVFVTAFDQFALQAFEAQAIDYLLKPFGEERVRQALERVRTFLSGGARREVEARLAALLRAAESRESADILVKKRERTLVLRPADIDLVEAYGDYVRLHVGSEIHTLRATLSDMERRLASAGFARIHRSRLVNWERVREFTADREHEPTVVLKNGTRLAASAALLRDIEQKLGETRSGNSRSRRT